LKKITNFTTYYGLHSITLISANASAQILSIGLNHHKAQFGNTMSNGIAKCRRFLKPTFNLVVQPYSGNRAMMDAVNQGLAEFAIMMSTRYCRGYKESRLPSKNAVI